MSPKELFATVINSASDARTDRILADVAAAVPVHYEPLGQGGASNTACGVHAAPHTSSNQSKVTCMDCLEAMSVDAVYRQVMEASADVARRKIRILRFVASGFDVVANVELVGTSFRVREIQLTSIVLGVSIGAILANEIVAIFNGITAALRDIGELLPPQSTMEPAGEDPEPFDEATGPDDLRERVREYEAGIEGCRE